MAITRDKEIAKMLIDADADATLKDSEGNTALIHANETDLAQLLLLTVIAIQR